MDSGTSMDIHEQLLSAARELTSARGVSALSLESVAAHAETDVASATASWPDVAALVFGLWQETLSWQVDTDTGSLQGDLEKFAGTVAASVAEPVGRDVFLSALPRDGFKHLNRLREQFWKTQFDSAEPMLIRARQRGELAAGIDTADAIRMLGTALCFDPLYKNQALRPDYVAAVIDIFLHGIAQTRSATSPITPAEEMRLRSVTQTAIGEDNSAAITDYFMANSRQIRQAILDHAVEEHVERGISGFAVDSVARRAGVTTAAVERMFRHRRDLMVGAALDTTRRGIPDGDSGSLTGDIFEFALNKAAIVHTEKARSYLNSLLPTGHSDDIEAIRNMWHTRFEEVGHLFARAEERGELRPGIDHGHAMRMIACAVFYDPFFNDQPVRPAFAIQALDIFLNGVTKRP